MTMEGKTSVLAKLTAEVMAEKRTAAKALTPVEGEARPTTTGQPLPTGPLDGKHKTSFPFDDPQTILIALSTARKHVDAIRSELDHVADGVKALETLYGGGIKEDSAPDPKAAQKEREKEADESFKERQERLAAEAQEAVFKPKEVSDSWVCPDHGEAIDKVSSKGRPFRGCPTCNKFER